jgi:molybdate transport system substrate-binding protein
MQRIKRRLLGWALLFCVSAATAQGAPTIAAASDLKFALDEVVAAFHRDTGQAVRVTYGASGNLFRQIAQGAPFELFLSADEGFVFQLADAQLTPDRGVLYAQGRLVVFAPHASTIGIDGGLAGVRQGLRDGRIRRFAIANPEHAPYGRAAREALHSAGLWDAVQPTLVLGENVAQAAQFAASGSAQAGLFAHSLALAPALAAAGRSALVPEHLHAPLRQRMVLTRRAGDVARSLYAWLQQPQARGILKRHGFALPGETGS